MAQETRGAAKPGAESRAALAAPDPALGRTAQQPARDHYADHYGLVNLAPAGGYARTATSTAAELAPAIVVALESSSLISISFVLEFYNRAHCKRHGCSRFCQYCRA